MSRATVPNSKARKAWSEMTTAELAAATAGLEGLDYKDTRPPIRTERSRRSRKTRKLPWDQAMRALAVSDPQLLSKADLVADANGLKRSELIARALSAVIAAMNSPVSTT